MSAADRHRGARRHDEDNVRQDTGTRCRHRGSNGRRGGRLRPRTFNFTVATFRFVVRLGTVKLVLREGDGTEHHATGSVHALDPPRRIAFALDPLDPDGRELFTAQHEVRLTAVDGGTRVELTVTPSAVRAGAEAALGGLGIGWEQLLDNLVALAADGGLSRTAGARSRECRS